MNYFLKVDKELFNSGLSPLEILLVAQVTEFQNNTGDCFISDKVLAENFGVSESTITRALKALETKGYITRETKNVRNGKERHIKVNEYPTTSKMTDAQNGASSKMLVGQQSNCLLGKQQNDLIKDNIIDNRKDNNSGAISAKAESSALESAQQEELEIDGVKAIAMDRIQLVDKYGLTAAANAIPTAIKGYVWINKELIHIVA